MPTPSEIDWTKPVEEVEGFTSRGWKDDPRYGTGVVEGAGGKIYYQGYGNALVDQPSFYGGLTRTDDPAGRKEITLGTMPTSPVGTPAGTDRTTQPVGSGIIADQTTIPRSTDQTLHGGRVMVQDPTQTVEGRMGGLLADESDWIKLNRAAAERAAHARGLQNTTMAARAGQAAAIEGALPIAQQDAQAYQQALVQAQEGLTAEKLADKEHANELLMLAEQAKHQAALYRQQGDINSALQAEAAEQELTRQAAAGEIASEQSWQDTTEQAALNRQMHNQNTRRDILDHQQDIRLNRLQANLDAASARQQFTRDTAAQNSEQAFQLLLKNTPAAINMTELDVNRQATFAGHLYPLMQQYTSDRTNILLSEDLSNAAKQRALDMLDNNMQRDIGILADAMGVDIDWDTAGPGAGAGHAMTQDFSGYMFGQPPGMGAVPGMGGTPGI